MAAFNGGLRSGLKLVTSSQSSFARSVKPASPVNEAGMLVPMCHVPSLFGHNKVLQSRHAACPASRGLHATGIKSMGGHGHDSEPFYIHAKHMYNLDQMKHQKLKMSLGVFSAFSIGVGVPVYAVVFQQNKTASG